MKKRIFWIGFTVGLTALVLSFFLLPMSVYLNAEEGARSQVGEAIVLSIPAFFAILAILLTACSLSLYFSLEYMLKPLDTLAKEGAKNQKIEGVCPELLPLANVINRMRERLSVRLKEVEEEKELVLKAQGSKNEFIANITHEMNTPLTSIKGFAELLAGGNLSPEQAKRASDTILAQTERLTNLFSCIIHYNEIDSEELPLYEVNASKIAMELLETLAPSIAERNLTVSANIQEDVLLNSRYERVTEIFGNLIRNAIRYNRDGGRIAVALNAEAFTVSDTGIGISEENLERIFDRFFTVDKSHGGKNGGFGLGLAVVKKLCIRAGWKLSVNSQLDKGTTFCVSFVQK